MKKLLFLILFVQFDTIMVLCQSTPEIVSTASDAPSISFNDAGVQFINEGRNWEAIQAFERAIRCERKQRWVAVKNEHSFREYLDLPAHSLLHFGWSYGIGKLSHILFINVWMLLSIVALIGIIILYFFPDKWSLKKIFLLLTLGVLTFALSYYRGQYLNAVDLVIFKQDTELKEKPYDVSGEKQIVFEGQMGKVEQQYEGFLLVQTDTYEYGWVSKEHTSPIWEETNQ